MLFTRVIRAVLRTSPSQRPCQRAQGIVTRGWPASSVAVSKPGPQVQHCMEYVRTCSKRNVKTEPSEKTTLTITILPTASLSCQSVEHALSGRTKFTYLYYFLNHAVTMPNVLGRRGNVDEGREEFCVFRHPAMMSTRFAWLRYKVRVLPKLMYTR